MVKKYISIKSKQASIYYILKRKQKKLLRNWEKISTNYKKREKILYKKKN